MSFYEITFAKTVAKYAISKAISISFVFLGFKEMFFKRLFF